MSHALPVSSYTPTRISRHDDLKGEGSFWDMCRSDDADLNMVGPLSMSFALPAEMLDRTISTAVWTKWYGGLRNAREAGKLAGRMQSKQEIEQAGNLRDMDPLDRLTYRLDQDLALLACDSNGEFRHHAADRMPMTKINQVMLDILGADTCNQIYMTVTYSRREELAEAVEGYFPAMRALHDKGLMLRSASQHLIAIGLLVKKLDDPHLIPVDMLVVKLVISCLMRTLPGRLAMLVAVTTPVIGDIFEQPCMFYGVTSDTLKATPDIWAQLPDVASSATANGLIEYSAPLYFNAYLDDESYFDQLIRRIDSTSHAIAKGQDVGDQLNSIYQDFLGEYALADCSQLAQLLNEGGTFFEVTAPAVTQDMIRSGLNMNIPNQQKAVIDALFDLVVASFSQSGTSCDMEVLREYQSMIEATGARVKKLSQNATQKDVDKIQRAGKEAMKNFEMGKEWFALVTEGYSALIKSWAEFNTSIEQLRA